MILHAESCENMARVNGALCRLWVATDDRGESYYLFVALAVGPESSAPAGCTEAMVPVEEPQVEWLDGEVP